MVGLLPLFDPPRHDTKDTIEECLKKGISVKMVTGGTDPFSVIISTYTPREKLLTQVFALCRNT